MPGRYSRFYSNYILKKKHQNISSGTIWERDWVTIGAKHQIEKGKRPFFGDSGFLYTINNIPTTKKRHDYGKWLASWFYDDVENSTETVNSVEVNRLSNDIRDFVYYGSCVELIRSSIVDIIANYPGVITTETVPKRFTFHRQEDDMSYSVESPGFKLLNPFNVDLIHSDIDENEVNVNHFLAYSWANFEIDYRDYGTSEMCHFDEITEYTVIQNEYYNKKSGYGMTQKSYDNLDSEELKNDYKEFNYNLPPDCNYYKNTVDVIITAINTQNEEQKLKVILKGYDFGDSFIFCLNRSEILFSSTHVSRFPDDDSNTTPEITIKPKAHVVEEFFDNLDDFQKLLLREDTKPLFKNTFLTPYETDTGIHYVYMDYTWPVQILPIVGSVIDVASPIYYEYIDRLYKLGQSLDELWTDNLWRNMTHESIKNYDWTYRRTFQEGDEEDNIIGGQRMEHLVRVYGRYFDDLKRYVDGIKLTNRVSYDGYNNRPEAELSDRLDCMGWDIFSTIPTTEQTDEEGGVINLNEIPLDDEFITNNGYRWFPTVNSNSITPTIEDNQFMRMLSLSSKYILKSKGTIKSIEMMLALFGLSDVFDVTEEYRVVIPRLYDEREVKRISDLNNRDTISKSYYEEEMFAGIPLDITEIYNNRYIVPFYSSKKYYESGFTFQSKGGWGADSEDATTVTKYIETLSYLKVVGNISELLSLNPYDVRGEKAPDPSKPDDTIPGDIYYVIDLSDITQYDENFGKYEKIDNPLETITQEEYDELSDSEKENYIPSQSMMTHFYICKDDVFVERYSSWENIRTDSTYYSTALYLDSIISTDVGNNPHVGYGNYDLGESYYEYMSKPFKYILDTYSLSESVREQMDDNYECNYDISDPIQANDRRDKCFDLITNSEERDKFFAETLRERDRLAQELSEKALCVDFTEIQRLQNEVANLNSILDSARYYLNSKKFILTNKIRYTQTVGEDEETYTPTIYKNYFFDVILPYIMQVIPSTAILVLKDFD